MRMVRVLGVLPGFVGFVCLILLTVSLVGIEIDSTRVPVSYTHLTLPTKA